MPRKRWKNWFTRVLSFYYAYKHLLAFRAEVKRKVHGSITPHLAFLMDKRKLITLERITHKRGH
jgi:hypothetical protein